MKIPLLAITLLAATLVGCVHNDPRVVGTVKTSLRNKDGTLVAIFRNNSDRVVSFDYTLADRADVVHVDAEGPNSGLVANLYPGEEREVPNPSQKSILYPKFGSLTYGIRSSEYLEKKYKPRTAQQAKAMDASLLGTLPGLPAGPGPTGPLKN